MRTLRTRAGLTAGLILALAAPLAHAGTIVEQWTEAAAPPAPELARPTVKAAATALLVLDIEERTCNKERRPRCLDTVPGIGAFLDKARAAGMMVAHSVTGQSAPEAILPPAAPRPGEPVVRASVDKFLGTELDAALKARKIDTVIVCGTAAHGAVLHTATGAAQRQYKVVLPVDCLSAEDLFTEKASVWVLLKGPATARVITVTTLDAIRVE